MIALGWMIKFRLVLLAAFFFIAFLLFSTLRSFDRGHFVEGRVVVPSFVAVFVYGGDRYFAAGAEGIRLAVMGLDNGLVDVDYLVRAQKVVAELNPCHEDNYYLANGLLAWGGAVDDGNDILRRAMECRFWDGVPAFFYGINLSFFDNNADEAARVLEESARRWPENSAALRKLAVMLKVEQFSDERLALNYLTQQRDAANEQKLRDMLDRRVIRLQGLVDLRAAQRSYEKNHGALTDLNDLVNSGELDVLPQDPLNLGYELRNGRIELGKLKIAGLEEQP